MERARGWRWDFIIVALMVVVACCLVPPLLVGARERSRTNQCGNHLKELAIALQNYHDTFLYLPYGARVRTVNDEPSMGPSWLVSTMPFWGNPQGDPVYDRLVACDRAEPNHDYASSAMYQVVAGRKFATLVCPSSPLPELELVNGSLLTVPSYVGLMGADARMEHSDALHPAEGEHGFYETRNFPGVSNGDCFSLGGMLCVNESLTMAACTDGTANTLLLGESSNWYVQNGKQHRVDGSSGGSWLSGTACPVNLYEAKEFPSVAYNLTSLRYPCNLDGNAPGAPRVGEGGSGIAVDHGANNPLLSAHPHGVMMAYLDGHVQLMHNSISVITLKRLVTRDEGGVICDSDEDQFAKPASASSERSTLPAGQLPAH